MSSTPVTNNPVPNNPSDRGPAGIDDLRLLQRRLESVEDDVAHLIAVVDAHADLLHAIGVLTSEHEARFDPRCKNQV